MIETISKVVDFAGWFSVLGTVFAIMHFMVRDLWRHEGPRERWAAWLEDNSTRRLYRILIDSWLVYISDFFARHEANARNISFKDAASKSDFKLSASQPWSWGVLDISLFMAVLFPLTAFFTQWALIGNQGRVGQVVLIPSEPNLILRTLIIGAIFAVLFFAINSKTSAGANSRISSGISIIIGYFVSWKLATTIMAALFGKYAYFDTFTAIMVGITAVSGVIYLSLTAAAAAIGAVFVEYLRTWLESRIKRRSIALLLWAFLLLFILAFQIAWVEKSTSPDDIANATIVFLGGVLPIIVGIWSWISLGFSRWTLGKGARQNILLFSMLDLVNAALSIIGMGTMLIATILIIKSMGGDSGISLDIILGNGAVSGSILNSPHDYWWLYVVFLALILPSISHAAVATFAIASLWPKSIRDMIAGGLRSGLPDKGRFACMYLSFGMTCSAIFPILLIYVVVSAHVPILSSVGEQIVLAFRSVATLMGAI